MSLKTIDLKAVLAIDGGEVFGQLGGSQRVRCHVHTDVDIGTVKRERLNKPRDSLAR